MTATAVRTDWRRPLYFVLGWVFVVLATLGVFLPLLPTTPFLLLASSCFLRSSPRWQAWLMRSRWFGPMLRDWNEHRAVRRPVKVVAIITVSIVLVFAMLRDLHWAIRAGIFLLGGIGLWVVWRLPVRPGGSGDGEWAASRSSSVVTAPREPADNKDE